MDSFVHGTRGSSLEDEELFLAHIVTCTIARLVNWVGNVGCVGRPGTLLVVAGTTLGGSIRYPLPYITRKDISRVIYRDSYLYWVLIGP